MLLVSFTFNLLWYKILVYIVLVSNTVVVADVVYNSSYNESLSLTQCYFCRNILIFLLVPSPSGYLAMPSLVTPLESLLEKSKITYFGFLG